MKSRKPFAPEFLKILARLASLQQAHISCRVRSEFSGRRRMVKNQQMRWSKRGAHLMLQVRAAVKNDDLREQLSYEPPIFKSRLDWMFQSVPPLLKAA
jgi:hypothetical protein